MKRLTAFAALFLACGSSTIVACGGSAVDLNPPLDGGADSTQPLGCTSETCPDGAPEVDATLDGGGPGPDATPSEDTGSPNPSDDAGEEAGIDAPVDSPTGEDASDGAPVDSGKHDDDSGEHSVDSGTDAGDHTVDAGTDSGEHAVDSGVDSGTDAGEHALDAGTDSGNHDIDSGVTIPDGGLPPTPGEVACGGNSTCDVDAGKQCCLLLDGGGDCIGPSDTCPGQSATVTCNEASDCPGSQLCCVSVNIGTGTATAACQVGPCTSAVSGGAQACRTDQECGSSGPCELQSCGGVTLELCGLPDFFGFFQCTPE